MRRIQALHSHAVLFSVVLCQKKLSIICQHEPDLKNVVGLTDSTILIAHHAITFVMDGVLTPETEKCLREYIDRKTSGDTPEIPGLLYQAIDLRGTVLFKHASGRRGLESSQPMTFDTIFYLASFTKLITSIACMQLVERGILRLDDASQVADLAPELENVQVLEQTEGGGFQLVPKDRQITLRMLMTHTGMIIWNPSALMMHFTHVSDSWIWLRIRRLQAPRLGETHRPGRLLGHTL